MRHLALAFALALLGLVACDPPGPGAAGTITLPAGTTTSGFTRIEILAFPDDGAAFDPLALPADDGNGLRNSVGIASPAPWAYEVSDGFGGSPYEHWRVVAWLGTDDELEAPARVPAHARYGTRTFTVDGCGFGVDGYCGTVHDVDLVLDQRAPE